VAFLVSDPTRPSGDLPRSGVEPDDEIRLQLFAEELSVAKEKLETGRVHVSTRTHEREAAVDEDLARERVEVETIPMNLQIDAVPDVRQEGDTTIRPVYFGLSDDFTTRNSRRSIRIANNKNRMTSAIAAAGAASARKDIKSAPPSSAVAMMAFPRPPVRAVE
jgi:hypothetical protein